MKEGLPKGPFKPNNPEYPNRIPKKPGKETPVSPDLSPAFKRFLDEQQRISRAFLMLDAILEVDPVADLQEAFNTCMNMITEQNFSTSK